MRCSPTLLFSSLLLVAWLWPSAALAQVRRCTGPDGGTVYTDRRCADMANRQGYAVLNRLSGVVKRPLVDIAALMPRSADGVDGDLYPQTSVRRAPVGLRIEQTLANGSTPSRTVFGLVKHLDCWWIRG